MLRPNSPPLAEIPAVSADTPPTAKPGRSPFDDVIELASRLTALMIRENECLQKFDIKGMTALQEEKQLLTRAYCNRVYQIKKDPSRLAAVAVAVREEVKSAMARFEEAARANEKILRSTREANDRVLKVIVDAANSLAPRVPSYSRTGAMARPYGNSRAPTPPPVSINSCV